ncbi:response regulator transcription factor [Vagococcus fluvialis]|jgi:DNA-binding response OmpR family regulator|uniref:response regulator transcription factor n=1 Tax=Vagococcus fluvialis TaxID=2738 RepID=UPI001D0A7BDC|nr:response regulator transcription factor [Vagococcus fluvialis]MDR2276346.1 response regulator transcription factor [Vagococcus sp.]UDM71802.1 response regulator transcription factor [Vagococcus fluvialis]UDM76667.1 response regulator transcription factor [Vagococcus fluvialis]UDM83496.1 response regulator transcription factor [Vagococcus fluvialis]
MITILVVDDELNTRKFLKTILEKEHYKVITAEDGEAALEKMETHHIDLIVLDIMMPKIDGYELTKLLRETQNDLPILMLSAKHLPVDKKKGFVVGTDDYMSKPVDEEEMLLRIKALLRRAKIATERKITIGRITLDHDSLSINSENDTQVLPQKEFELLYKLFSYPDKIFTRIQLMDEIWGVESDTGWETVTVHIARLRKKIEQYDEFEIISIRGLGYKGVKHV